MEFNLTKVTVKRNPYSDLETDFIKSTYTELSDTQIAGILGRSKQSIAVKRHQLNLHKNDPSERVMISKIPSRVVDIYLKDKSKSWLEIGLESGYISSDSPREKQRRMSINVRGKIGRFLVKKCREKENCVFKPLLPEYEVL